MNKNQDLDDTNLSKAEHCKNTRCVLKMRGKKKRIWMMSYHCKRRMRKSARMQRLLWMRLRRSSARLMAGLWGAPPTATRCNTQQRVATHCNTNVYSYIVDEAEEELGKIDGLCWRRPPSATHRNALQHTATYSSTIHKYIYTFTHNRLHMYVDIHRHDV